MRRCSWWEMAGLLGWALSALACGEFFWLDEATQEHIQGARCRII